MFTSTDRWTYKWQDIGACVYNNIHTCTMAYDLGFGFIARKIMCLYSMCSNYKLGSQNYDRTFITNSTYMYMYTYVNVPTD